MKVTVDANILFSALLKKGATRRIWFNPVIKLYALRFLLIEFKKHVTFLQKEFEGSKDELQLLSQKLLSQIIFVQDSDLKHYLPATASLASLSKDAKDWSCLACALKEDTIIWSNDREFKKQNRVKVKTTSEMTEETRLL